MTRPRKSAHRGLPKNITQKKPTCHAESLINRESKIGKSGAVSILV